MSRHKSKNKTKIRFRLFLLLPLFLGTIVFLSYSCGTNLLKLMELNNEKKNLKKQLVALTDEKENLEADVQKLSDSTYIARYAREKYLYSKKDEIIIRIEEED